MAILNVYKEQLSEYTVISNYFIDHYMEDANEAQLQVYLYLLRMVSANLPVSVADIADKFKHSEKEVLRALKYWELQKLISLDFDKEKNLTGIHFRAIPAPAAEAYSSPAVAAPISDTPGSVTIVTDASAQQQASVSQQPACKTEQTPNIYVKPAYTMAQLKSFKEQEASGQLIYVAETYVGKTLSPSDINTIYFMWDILHFSDDLIDYLVQYCVEQGKRDFRYMEKVAIRWAEEGITTPEQAKQYAAKYDKSVYGIMKALGKTGHPTAKELEFINRWMNEYEFSLDIILEACDRTVLATDSRRFSYAEGILSSWKRDNVQTKGDIAKVESSHRKQKSSTPAPKTAGSSNPFNQFPQNTYDFAALEEGLLSN